MSMTPQVINYTASYTGGLFHASKKEIKGMRGVVGSGKSVAMCFEIKRKSHYEMPAHDGLRWSKWLVGRKTYDDLKKTTIATWLTWFPSPVQTKMHWSPPLEGRIEEPCMQNDGTTVRIDLLFYPLDAIGIIDSLKSLDLSGAWINEATQVGLDIVDAVWDRLGRFNQAPNFTGPRLGLIMDTNTPDESNWWYDLEQVKKPNEIDFFIQPPALLKKVDPKTGEVWYENNDGRDPAFLPAENIENLGEGFEYYHKQTLLGDEEKIKKNVLNQYGSTMDGKPVYPEYNDQIHFTNKELKFEAGMPLILGQDFGRTPATIIAQMSTTGQLRCIEEIVSDNMGIRQFVEEKLRPLLINKYRFPSTRVMNWADPAGASPDQISEITCINVMNQYGICTKPAPVPQNAFTLRRDCVADLLRQRRDTQAGILVGPGCPMLRKGFNGGYRYRRMKMNTVDEIYAEAPEKNEFSHIHDAFQYLCYGALKSGIDFGSPVGSPYGVGGAYQSRQMNTGLELGGFGC